MLYVASRALQRISGGRVRLIKYYLVAQPVRSGTSLPERAGGVEIVAILEGDPLTAQFPRPPAVVAKRYADGAVCLAARAAGRFAGFLWLSPGPYDEDEVRCRYTTLPEGRTAWDFDVYVDPAFRMGRTFARLWDAANALLHKRGVEWTLSRISAFNAESLRAHARFGVRRIGAATFFCIGAVQLTLATLWPYVHLSVVPTSGPKLRLHAPSAEVS